LSLTDCYQDTNSETRTLFASGPTWRVLGFGSAHRADGDLPPGEDAFWVGNIVRGDPLDRTLGSLDGQFALTQIRSASPEVRVVADPFGMYGLYAYEGPEISYFSTSAVALARHLRLELDDIGVNCFLRTGSLFGRRTLFAGLSRVMPAECTTFSSSGVRTETYWEPRPDGQITDLRFKDVVSRTAESVRLSLNVSLADRSPLAADLTGGLDSRMLSLLLDGAGLEFTAITDGPTDAADSILAREVAGLKGWDWVANPSDPGDDRMLLTRSALAWGGGALEAIQLGDVLGFHTASPLRQMLRIHAGAGEIARDFFWIQEMTAAGRTNKVNVDRLIDLRIVAPSDLRPFAVDPTALVWDELRSSLLQQIAPLADEVNTFQLEVLYALRCRGGYGAYLSATAAATSGVFPFFFRDVFVAFTSIKARYRLQHHFQGALIQFLDDNVARLRTTRGGPALPYTIGNVGRQLPYIAQQGSNLARRTARKYGSRFSRRTAPRGPAVGADSGGSDEWFDLIRFLFGADPNGRSDWAVGALLSPDGFDDLVRDARAGRAVSRVMLARLATVEGVSRMVRGDL